MLEWCARTANLTLGFVSLRTAMSSQQMGQQNFDTEILYVIGKAKGLICITSQGVEEDKCEEELA